MKPFYYLCDFPERKNAGKNFVTELSLIHI